MKIAYVTSHDPRNIGSWSGIVYYMGKTLEEKFNDVAYIGNLHEVPHVISRGKWAIYKYLFNKKYLIERETAVVKNYAEQVNRKLRDVDADVIISPGTIPIAELETNKPIVFWTDACFAGMVGFYPEFSNLCEESIRDGHNVEKAALQRCKLAIYSSEWAAQTATRFYGVDKSKVKVVPFGANIEHTMTDNEIKEMIEKRPQNKCKLLFMGVDWTRKGGDIAVKITEELNKSGLESELTVVGCQPPINESLPPFIKVLGFISGNERNNLFAESHFFILPSRAEAYGIVFCEANAFGVPCVATNVGGIPTIIKEGINGKTFPKDADIEEYCSYISNLFFNYSEYKRLALSSLNEYRTRLNWSVAGDTLKNILMESIY
jgi:glycosyltransferase involved in cell wall biosynthesis